MNFNTSNSLPETGFVRIPQLIGSSNPPIPAIFPFSRSTLWAKIKAGTFPAPLKPFGPRIVCWRVEDIRMFIESAGEVKP